MTLTQPSESRVLPVRLTQIRPAVRFRAAQQIAERSPGDAAECLFAALFPSDQVYWVGLEAVGILRAIAA